MTRHRETSQDLDNGRLQLIYIHAKRITYSTQLDNIIIFECLHSIDKPYRYDIGIKISYRRALYEDEVENAFYKRTMGNSNPVKRLIKHRAPKYLGTR